MADMKPCPYCAEEIRAEAVRCRYCRSRLSSFEVERWHRDHPEARVAGVCAALARALAVPVAAVRLTFIVLTFFHMLGPMLYAGFWLIMPPRPGATSLVDELIDWTSRAARRAMSGSATTPPNPAPSGQ